MTKTELNRSFTSALKILIVGDEFPKHPAVAELFCSSGFELRTAANSIDGIQRIAEWEPDAVLSDAELSDLSAAAFCKIVRDTTGNELLPFIVLADSRQNADDIRAMFSCGADDYINLSLEPQALIAKLDWLVRRRTAHGICTQVAKELRTRQRDVLSMLESTAAIFDRLDGMQQGRMKFGPSPSESERVAVAKSLLARRMFGGLANILEEQICALEWISSASFGANANGARIEDLGILR